MTDLPVHRFRGDDGVELAWRSVGSGRPFVLLHGLMGSGALLAGQGLVASLAGHGCRVILPDLRGHGDSGRPHDPACYPPDVLADDGLALIGHLGLDDYDLGGYSMGGKLVLRLLARGARPAHAVVGGQGLDALDAESDRTDGHRRILAAVASGASFPPGAPEAGLAEWIRQSGADARAVGYVLGTFTATPPDVLREVPVPTLVVVGDRDSRGASAGPLAALLPHGRLVSVPGDHLTALSAPEFATAVLEFLGRPLPVNARCFRRRAAATRASRQPAAPRQILPAVRPPRQEGFLHAVNGGPLASAAARPLPGAPGVRPLQVGPPCQPVRARPG